ncbi:non-hydrolyzing UDP-N-acetylglucosamine 2-epimerase [Enterovibrio sp. 27052020O]|uniref:non-hydrolyzing UDP-N-acetylglucosamine 2-epimerase n=1 Tax=Enterovibrio sp. 27052020O TaxID=3241166 RepID=UPI00388E0687
MDLDIDVLIITGTRPEVIKMAPVYHALQQESLSVVWCHSGQHDTLATQAFSYFNITPDFSLTRPNTTELADLFAGLLAQLNGVIQAHHPKCVIVHGDTSSTLAAAMAAFYNKVAIIAHVEAGLRSGDIYHPFPEEVNRKQVAVVVNRHYSPTVKAAHALFAEGIAPETVICTGNTVVDAQMYLLKQSKITTPKEKRTVLITVHRRENWVNLPIICLAINRLVQQHPLLTFRFVTHPNPLIKQQIQDLLSDSPNLQISDPLDYLNLQQALADSALVLTDSGGIQEEAPTYDVPVVVLRETTERPEACQLGLAILAGATDPDKIVDAAQHMLNSSHAIASNPYGDGKAAQTIASDIKECIRGLS